MELTSHVVTILHCTEVHIDVVVKWSKVPEEVEDHQISLCQQTIQVGGAGSRLTTMSASDGAPVKLSQHNSNGKTITQIESDLQGWSLNQLAFITQSKQVSLASLCWPDGFPWW